MLRLYHTLAFQLSSYEAITETVSSLLVLIIFPGSKFFRYSVFL